MAMPVDGRAHPNGQASARPYFAAFFRALAGLASCAARRLANLAVARRLWMARAR